ncbi:MAG: hypothetical protein KDE09_22635 [Anaerolineales bacterium]|nr:hypothetical protein [Anaerolineales bacterium]MCB8961594.1 hypothetical protein [Ardenticatenales bacterium]MCB0007245.1 hypothetical protein [Anaerolineales bacterium]MCB0012546.1 hypothetical protein [Anaerolineales bacterium]MCB0020615.1 hypothetical protein [Anaerolineales bacterium]
MAEYESRDPADKSIKANMLEAMVEASLQGHNLGTWEMSGEDTYVAHCEKCSKAVYVNAVSIRSLMAAKCPEQATVPKIISDLRAAAHTADSQRFEEALHTLLAHFSDFTSRQLAANPRNVDKAWEQLPAEYQRQVTILRNVLEKNIDDHE